MGWDEMGWGMGMGMGWGVEVFIDSINWCLCYLASMSCTCIGS